MKYQEQSSNAAFNERIIKTRFSDLTGGKILDAGCGYGHFTDYFRTIGAVAAGCDGFLEMLKIAGQKYPQCSFKLTDLEGTLPYGDSEFDVVFCNQALMDIEHPDGLSPSPFLLSESGLGEPFSNQLFVWRIKADRRKFLLPGCSNSGP